VVRRFGSSLVIEETIKLDWQVQFANPQKVSWIFFLVSYGSVSLQLLLQRQGIYFTDFLLIVFPLFGEKYSDPDCRNCLVYSLLFDFVFRVFEDRPRLPWFTSTSNRPDKERIIKDEELRYNLIHGCSMWSISIR